MGHLVNQATSNSWYHFRFLMPFLCLRKDKLRDPIETATHGQELCQCSAAYTSVRTVSETDVLKSPSLSLDLALFSSLGSVQLFEGMEANPVWARIPTGYQFHERTELLSRKCRSYKITEAINANEILSLCSKMQITPWYNKKICLVSTWVPGRSSETFETPKWQESSLC